MPRTEPWTIKRVLDWTSGYLERKGDEHPRLSAEWLLANVCGLSRVELYVNFDKPLEAGELDAMHAAIERRAAGEPLQYVTGEMPFRHIVLKCERGVLIPRPETEVLVDAALEGVDAAAEKSDEGAGPVRVLEVGTGTGCIALSIASERPGALVTANFGSNPAGNFSALKSFSPDGPEMCMEFWCGWFDRFRGRHHTRPASSVAKTMASFLERGASFNMYMFHGGTNFGFGAGANFYSRYTPTVTSYDYCAPLGEYGGYTPAYHAIRR